MFDLKYESSDLPAVSSAHQSSDPVQLLSLKNQTFVFVRTLSNASKVYWNRFKGSLQFHSSKWKRLGDDDSYLISDAFAAVNTFLERIEVFGVFDNHYVLHLWQDGDDSFHDAWDKLGGPFSPKFNSAPAVHQMGHSNFNGVLNLFVRGEDGYMHHISQTTCDKVNNVWGPCTWGFFHALGGTPPSDPAVTNPFTVSHSIHGGMEVSPAIFAV